jgi:hypothetical protein
VARLAQLGVCGYVIKLGLVKLRLRGKLVALTVHKCAAALGLGVFELSQAVFQSFALRCQCFG